MPDHPIRFTVVGAKKRVVPGREHAAADDTITFNNTYADNVTIDFPNWQNVFETNTNPNGPLAAGASKQCKVKASPINGTYQYSVEMPDGTHVPWRSEPEIVVP